MFHNTLLLTIVVYYTVLGGPSSVVGIATGYGLERPGIESRWGGGRFFAPVQTLYNGYRVFPGGKERQGRVADPSPTSSAVIMKG